MLLVQRNTARLDREIAQLQRKNSQLMQTARSLEIEWSYRSRPEAIASLTKKFLPNMRSSQEYQFIAMDWFGKNQWAYQRNLIKTVKNDSILQKSPYPN